MEIWWDISEAKTLAELDRLVTLALGAGVKRVMVMVTKSKRSDSGKVRWAWSAGGLGKFCDALTSRGILMGVTTWAWPILSAIEEIDAGIQRIAAEVPLAEIELDLEGPWTRGNLSGYPSFADACSDLYRRVRAICVGMGAALGVTSYPMHGEWVQVPSVAQYADIATPQAYSRHEGEPDSGYRWDGRYGPGPMQRLAATRARRCSPEKLVMGLALYGQSGGGHEPDEWLDAALTAALRETPRVRYWSAKHVWGSQRKSAPARWLVERFGP